MGSTNRWILPAAGLVVLVVAIVLIIALCSGGGDDDDQSAGARPTATESTENGGDGEETPEPTAEEEDAAAALEDLSGAYGGVSAQVTYEFTSISGGESTSGTMTLYSDPPNARTDHEDASGETTSFINKGDQSFVCTTGQCFAYPAGTVVSPIPFVSQYAEPGAINSIAAGVAGVDVQTTEEEIAGIDARCFHLTSEGTALTWCFSDDGLLLVGASKSADAEFEMRATQVNRNVSDADFEPPFPVTEFPQ